MKNLVKAGLLFSLIGSSGMASAVELTINVDNFKNNEGNLILRIYNSESKWLSTDESGPVKTEVISLSDLKPVTKTFDLPKGIYAVTALQDLNSNHVMDRNWMGRPVEPVGETGGGGEKKGPPEFVTSSFELNAATEKTIHLLHY